ncbi:MAG: PEP-CTERM sorting domain-containing protein [Burkholderiales bacterium]|nr:PEP-CTERM sorting domain-containing protein [Burkholderiales bacterium]
MNLRSMTLVALMAMAGVAQAATISWNQWSSGTAGAITAPTGAVSVTYAGDSPTFFYPSYPSWAPAGSYADGSIVANAPTGGIKGLVGGTSTVNTVSFSTPVVDPVFSIWSLGSPGTPARFEFINATPIFVAGGPSNEYGGKAIVVTGHVVSGSESNGTIQFKGVYDHISWTNPAAENWYGFNVGIAAAVPEPQESALALAGLAMVGLWTRRRGARSGA